MKINGWVINKQYFRGHYLFREANSFPRAKLEENCELRGTDNVQGQISEHIFAAKLRLLTTFINGGAFCYSFVFMLIRPTRLTLV